MKKTLFSIVICTHNRAELAQAAIQSVLQQDFPADLYELLIVDNASTDETAQMVQAFCERYPHARYVFEPKIGLSNARNRGWQEGRGEYIGYLDDDAKAGPHWLATAHQVAETLRPLAFGGPYYPFYHSQKPAWFKDEYGSHTFGDQPRFLTKHEWITGGNMFIRREIIQEQGGFDPNLGMSGTKLAYAEESLLFARLDQQYDLDYMYYHPDIYIEHLVRPEKYELSDFVRRNFGLGRDFYTAFQQAQDSRYMASLKDVLRFVQVFVLGAVALVFRNRQQYPYFMNYVYEKLRLLPIIVGKNYARWTPANRRSLNE